MYLKDLLFGHLVVFNILGQLSRNPLLNSNYTIYQYLQFIPTAILLLATGASSTCLIAFQIYRAMSNDWTDGVVGILSVVSELLCLLAVIIQSLTDYNKMTIIVQQFQFIELYLHRRFHFKIKFRIFLKRYIYKVVVTMSIYLSTVVAKFLFPSFYDWTVEISYSVLRLFVLFIKLHALFYFSLLKSFYKFSMNLMNGKGLKSNSVNGDETAELIKQLKFIHYRLFVVARRISEIFGWTLIAVILQSFIESAYSSYWIFWYLRKSGQGANSLLALSNWNWFINYIRLYILLVKYWGGLAIQISKWVKLNNAVLWRVRCFVLFDSTQIANSLN